MMLNHYDIYYSFDFNKNFAYSLILENSNMFYNVCNQLINQSQGKEGDWICSSNLKSIGFDKLLCVYNYFDLNFSNKKIENLINSKVLKMIKEQDFIQEFSKISSLLSEINNKILSQIDLPISSSEELTYENFVKISNFQIDNQIDIDNKLITYIDVFVKLKDVNTVVLISCFDVYSQEQMHQIIKQLNYMGLKVLLINSHEKYNFLEVEKVIIDQDLCLI